MIELDPRRTALVLIDLQMGIVGRDLQPWTGGQVLQNAAALARRFRQAPAPVVLVRVMMSADYGDAPSQNVDSPSPRPAGGIPPDYAEFPAELEVVPSDILITKRQWGAFYGTELDLQLRRREVDTIVLGGIATNFGVESTARDAWERNYDIVFAEDAMSTMSREMHDFAVRTIFPRIGKITRCEEIVLA